MKISASKFCRSYSGSPLSPYISNIYWEVCPESQNRIKSMPFDDLAFILPPLRIALMRA